ncbi:MAG: ABC transporter ATP-binding protein [Deltaproteobacteria bacterium]|nr:ABC transporter ATP-binding protein [Deltaproteobacteria bacterium]
MEMLRVEGLSKNFEGLHVLQELSFTIKAGEKLAIIGPNGAGKTTLFNVIGGQLPASAGRIELLGQEISRLPTHRRLHMGLARSFQINSLFLHLTLIDNILLALQGARRTHFRMFRPMDSRSDLFAEARSLLESTGLWEMRADPVSSLSYGDQRLVEVAFGLASGPKLLMLDEPTAGLSTAEAAAFADTIRGMLVDATLFFCAHDMDLVFNLADRIIVLCFGQIIAEGGPEEIQADPKVREIYLGGAVS